MTIRVLVIGIALTMMAVFIGDKLINAFIAEDFNGLDDKNANLKENSRESTEELSASISQNRIDSRDKSIAAREYKQNLNRSNSFGDEEKSNIEKMEAQQEAYDAYLERKERWNALSEDEKQQEFEKAQIVRDNYAQKAASAISEIIDEEGLDSEWTQRIIEEGDEILNSKFDGTKLSSAKCGQTICTLEFFHKNEDSAQYFRANGGVDANPWDGTQFITHEDNEESLRTRINVGKNGRTESFVKVDKKIWEMVQREKT